MRLISNRNNPVSVFIWSVKLQNMYKIFLVVGLFLSGVLSTLSAHEDLMVQIQQLTKRIEKESNNANLYVLRGQLYAQHQEHAAAISDFRKAKKLHPDLLITDLLLAKVLAAQKRPKLALSPINVFLKNQPKHLDGLLIRAGIYQQLGNNVAAQKDFEQVILQNKKVQPKHYLAIVENFLSVDSTNIAPALAWLNKGQQQFGFDIVLKQKEIDLLVEHQLYKKALQRIDELLPHFQRKEQWLFKKGQILEKDQAFEQASMQYEATLATIAQLPKRLQMTKRMLVLEATTIERLQEVKHTISLQAK